MILVTVGENTPFDRLVRCVDEWAAARERDDVFAQIGSADYRPRHVRWTERMAPEQFREHLEQASVIVAHAGMGTILTALERGIPIVVMPRRADLQEQRNDHQLATARRMSERGLVRVAQDEDELRGLLDELTAIEAPERIPSVASPELLERLRRFIADA